MPAATCLCLKSPGCPFARVQLRQLSKSQPSSQRQSMAVPSLASAFDPFSSALFGRESDVKADELETAQGRLASPSRGRKIPRRFISRSQVPLSRESLVAPLWKGCLEPGSAEGKFAGPLPGSGSPSSGIAALRALEEAAMANADTRWLSSIIDGALGKARVVPGGRSYVPPATSATSDFPWSRKAVLRFSPALAASSSALCLCE